jgi:nucleoid DNA-binding protein
MEQYLLQILEKNNRIIVPEFGAFIVKQRKPLTIIFNEFLQYNDGLLVDTISKKDGINREKAKQKIDEFVGAINEALKKGEKYSLDKIGVIVRSSTGRISLEESGASAQSEKLIKEVKEITLETVEEKQTDETVTSLKEKKPPVRETKIKSEEKAKKAIPEVPIVSDKKKIKPIEEVKSTPDRSSEKMPAVSENANKKEIKEEHSQDTLSKQLITPTPDRNMQPANNVDKQKNTGVEKGKKINVIVWITFIIVINGAIIAYFLSSENLRSLSGLIKKKIETDTAIYNKPLVTENVQTSITPDEPIEQRMAGKEDTAVTIMQNKQPVTTVETKGMRYYVVAGVFSSEQNADKLVKELKQKGYNAEKFGKFDNLYAVSYNVYTNKTEADRMVLKIKKEYDPAVWIKVLE